MSDDVDTPYEDEVKNLVWRGFWKGWRSRVGTDSEGYHSRRTARSLFERWWEVNVE